MKRRNKIATRVGNQCLYVLYLLILLFMLSPLHSCNRNRIDTKRTLVINERVREDSLNKCIIAKKEALELLNRGNLILYRNIDDYLHAKEYFLKKYDIVLLPETKTRNCIQEVMDSVIFSKWGKDIVSIASKDISEIYKTIPKNQYSNGVYSYAEIMPEYPGGIDSLYCDIYSLVSSFKVCKINYEFGNELIVNFIIDVDGNIKDPTVIMKLCPEIDKKIIEVIKTLKKWSPAIFENKKVPFLMTLSIDWKKEDIQICKH
jgi:hypothetical protein